MCHGDNDSATIQLAFDHIFENLAGGITTYADKIQTLMNALKLFIDGDILSIVLQHTSSESLGSTMIELMVFIEF